MKKNIIAYALLFSLLYNVFQYVNATKMIKAKEAEVVLKKEQLAALKDSLHGMSQSKFFTLNEDSYAQEYLFDKNMDYRKVMDKVTKEIKDLNASTEGNKLVTYNDASIEKKYLINTIEFINHRWVIAEFSNGKLWGQVLLKYFPLEDKPTEFEVINTVLY